MWVSVWSGRVCIVRYVRIGVKIEILCVHKHHYASTSKVSTSHTHSAPSPCPITHILQDVLCVLRCMFWDVEVVMACAYV